MLKPLDIEITVLKTEQNKELFTLQMNNRKNGKQINEPIPPIEALKRKIRNHLNKLLEEVKSEDIKQLDEIKFEEKTPNLRYYYEEKGVYRLTANITLINDSILKKKVLNKLCENKIFRNTRFSIITNEKKFDWFKSLSANNKISTRVSTKNQSFSLGTLIDLTNYVEHYSSNYETQLSKNVSYHVAKDDIISDFQLDLKGIELIFRVTNGGSHRKHTKSIRYKLEYDFKSLNSVIFSMNFEQKVLQIYLTLNSPPKLYMVAIDEMDSSEKIEFYRTNRPFKPHYRRKFKTYKDLEDKHGVHTYDIQNNEIWIRRNTFEGCDKEVIGKSNVLLLEIPLIQNLEKAKESGRDMADPYRLLRLLKHFTHIPIYFGLIERHDCPSNKLFFNQLIDKFSKELKKHGINSFGVDYAFNSIFSLNFFPSDELFFKNQTSLYIEKVVEYAKQDLKTTEETLFELFALNDRNVIFCSLNALEKIFEEFKERNEKIRKENLSIDSNNTEIEYIRKCILTPTRLIMLSPQPTLKSRFIVNNEPQYTIRLSIRDDNLKSLQYSVGNQKMDKNSIIEKMIKEPLMDGIIIGDRVYEFLGSSTSQLRDTGLILYAKDSKGRTAQQIRESIGDLSRYYRNVPKYVARLGLAFSQVMTHIEVPKNQTDIEKDIERNKFNFSDGIGRVSMDLMERVYEKLKIESKHRPTAMQIRYGGYKGMLVVDPTLKGNKKIIFRESMAKYESNDELLGIIKMSAPRPLYLNRPLITILDQLGIEDKVLLEMLLNDLKTLSNSMICECSATKLLQSSSTLGIPYRKLFKSEIPFLSEPLFRQIIDSVINHRITELKLKGRIKLPMEMGRTVFGVMDETGTLEYGQVFVQLSKVDVDNMPVIGQNNTDILEGEIMVTKFPCLHPGDVRKLEAVDVKELHHIKDCIVFPQNGDRPHPNEMAGSDLDGDEYAVIWDSPLIFKGENRKAMDFPPSEETILEEDLKDEDIIDFYCKYIVSNNVGLLASAHLARADTEKEGIDSEVCLSLAKKYSVALDFAKTGKSESIDWKERPFIYPDFMEKYSLKRTQLSRRILGQMYRHCDRISLGMHSKKKMEVNVSPNKKLKVEGYKQYLNSAKDRYKDYKRRIENLLNRFGVDCEATLLSGTFSQTSKYMSGRSETNDIHDLLENIINKVFIDFKDLFKIDSKDDNPEERRKRASAWYMVPFKMKDDPINRRYFGFSWTITEELCDLYKSEQTSNPKGEHSCVEFAAKILDNFFEDNYLYRTDREPMSDGSTALKDLRQSIMEKRCETAEVVIKAWLERQDHLFFKRLTRRRILISSVDPVISDMDRKLRRELIRIRIEELDKARNTDKPLKSAGTLVMSFLTNLIDNWFDVEGLDQNNRIVDTPVIKFGFSAFITLNHFFTTHEISHIVDISQKFRVSLDAFIKNEVFYIPLPVIRKSGNDTNTDNNEMEIDTRYMFTKLMTQRPEVFIESLKHISGAIEIFLEPYRLRMKCLRFYYSMTVIGTVWSVQAVKNFICHPSFFKIVANSEKNPIKRPNLRYKGDPLYKP